MVVMHISCQVMYISILYHLEFLNEKNLMSRKKDVASQLTSLNIKIMRRKNILKPERLRLYNDFLTEYKKELRSIIRRAKKNFGIVESTFIYNLFEKDKAFLTRRDVLCLKVQLKRSI